MTYVDTKTGKTLEANLNFAADKYHESTEKFLIAEIVSEPKPVKVTITDACTLADPPRLEREGFEVLDSPTSVVDFSDLEAVEEAYVPEMCRFIQQLTGADCVVPAGTHYLRYGNRWNADDGVVLAPGTIMHSDVTDKDAQWFIDTHPPTENRKIRRAVQHNIWRAFSTPPQDVPLAVCDARSLDLNDITVAEYRSDPDAREQLVFETHVARYNPSQRWLFYSEMNRDQALVFVRHDTDPSENKVLLHGAFAHPDATPEWTPRSSIEFRTLAYWYE
ncbi:CmcJ/NvfI family oxidoreductase [Mycolicibacterium baixiangningiae]|uniref:CmcJ/NvfI family oxidoreductase n=1 Tax=Mycolicibacterium baixiangningiae TaxID=2761578 RepID=UPI0018677D91|nr:CmcJ/NvfI family oxidoreductase [Mycolicibacterium baixiangningiae]